MVNIINDRLTKTIHNNIPKPYINDLKITQSLTLPLIINNINNIDRLTKMPSHLLDGW